jgi:chemotaxis protein MotB
VLNQQIASLRRQLAAADPRRRLEQKDKDRSPHHDLGSRLNVALAQRVQGLALPLRFFGRLRAILGNRPDIRIVGDRFVFQSEVFFDSARHSSTSRRPRRARPACQRAA